MESRGQSAQPDWRRLAAEVQQRRRDLGLTQEDVRGRDGPSTATMRLIEGALQDSYRPGILAGLERALNWAPRSVEAILGGGKPIEVTAATGLGSVGKSAVNHRFHAERAGLDEVSDDADIHLVMDSELPEDQKEEIYRELLAERAEDRRRRVERARRYVELYRRAGGE